MIIKDALGVKHSKLIVMQLSAVIRGTLCLVRGVVRKSIVEVDSNLFSYEALPSIASTTKSKTRRENTSSTHPLFSIT